MDGATIQIEAHDDNYLVENIMNGVKQSMVLSPADILQLAANAPQLRDRILESLSRPAMDAVAPIVVAAMEVGQTVHGDEVLVGLSDRHKVQSRFVFSLNNAKILGDALLRRVTQLQQIHQNQQH